MKKTLTLLVALALLGASALTASAGIIAFTPAGGAIVPGEPSGNDALFFTPKVNITVTALGYYDGVSYAHAVGLYEVTSVVGDPTNYSGTVSGVAGSTTLTSIAGSLLTSTSITGSGGSLVNNFYYNVITPVTLLAGQLYAVDGYYHGGPDQGVYATGGVGASPEIAYNYYLWDYAASGPDLPLNTYATAIFGPNFQYSVPDGGATLMLLGGALVGLGALRRKFRG
jgi:VPDSG-CTERM motif